jgi:hypothetical protein
MGPKSFQQMSWTDVSGFFLRILHSKQSTAVFRGAFFIDARPLRIPIRIDPEPYFSYEILICCIRKMLQEAIG